MNKKLKYRIYSPAMGGYLNQNGFGHLTDAIDFRCFSNALKWLDIMRTSLIYKCWLEVHVDGANQPFRLL